MYQSPSQPIDVRSADTDTLRGQLFELKLISGRRSKSIERLKERLREQESELRDMLNQKEEVITELWTRGVKR